MTPTKSGLVYLIAIVNFIAVSSLLGIFALRQGMFDLSLRSSILLSEGLTALPALIFALFSRTGAPELFHLKRVRPITLLLTVLLLISLEPLIGALNAFTMIFTDNEVLSMGDDIVKGNLGEMTLLFAIFGPLCEELTFRGVVFSGLRKSGRLLGAIVLQALMFACMHLNFNQMAYALVLGFVFGLLVEITGSIWPGFFAHALLNFGSVAALNIGGAAQLADSLDYSKGDMVTAFGMYGIIAIFTTVISACLIIFIAGCESGGRERLHAIFHQSPSRAVLADGSIVNVDRPHVYTPPALIALTIAFSFMVLTV